MCMDNTYTQRGVYPVYMCEQAAKVPLTISVLSVHPPVCYINLQGACSQKLQLLGIKHLEETHWHYL